MAEICLKLLLTTTERLLNRHFGTKYMFIMTSVL